MKFLWLIMLLSAIFCLLPSIGNDTVRTFENSQNKLSLQKQTESMRFISESFRKTCNGLGFENLDSWRRNCSALWDLYEIEWNSKECGNKGVLYQGFWNGPYGKGTVFEFVVK